MGHSFVLLMERGMVMMMEVIVFDDKEMNIEITSKPI